MLLPMGFVACNRHGDGPVAGAPPPPSKMNLKRRVEIAPVEKRSLDYFIEAVGRVEAERQTEIAAGVSGVVDEVLFREGDEVTTDTILIKVDQRRFQAAAAMAQANERRALASLGRAKAAVAQAQDLADRAREARAGISEEERTQKELALQVAEAEMRASEAELEALRSARIVAETNLDRSRVRPPYPGRINQRRVNPGSFIEDKTAIASIADLSRLRLVGFIPEVAVDTVRRRVAGLQASEWLENVGLIGGEFAAAGFSLPTLLRAAAPSRFHPEHYDAEFVLRAMPQHRFRARIYYISTVANPETHMFECMAEVPGDIPGISSQTGFFAQIRYPLRTNPEACVIPEEAVRPNERGFVAFVPVSRPGKDGPEWFAAARTLELGSRTPGWVEVRNGLASGEWIVRRGAEALEDGTPLQLANPPSPGHDLTPAPQPRNGTSAFGH